MTTPERTTAMAEVEQIIFDGLLAAYQRALANGADRQQLLATLAGRAQHIRDRQEQRNHEQTQP
jgi:hypothetical protein